MAGCLRLNYRYLASQKCHALGRGALLLPGVYQSDLITGEDSINRDNPGLLPEPGQPTGGQTGLCESWEASRTVRYGGGG